MGPALSLDTSLDAERVQIERWRAMTDVQKLGLVSEMSKAVFLLAKTGIRQRFPSASEREVFLRFAMLHLGADLARRVYPEIDALDLR